MDNEYEKGVHTTMLAVKGRYPYDLTVGTDSERVQIAGCKEDLPVQKVNRKAAVSRTR